MTVYVDYTYYTNTYLGTAIASTDFNALALRASAVIDQVTFNRAGPVVTAGTDTTTIAAIKNATCAVAEELQKQQTQPDAVQSESQGQYSVSYARNSTKMKSNQTKLESAAKLY